MPEPDHLAACMSFICHKDLSRNPVAWFYLEMDGLTRELLQEASKSDDWTGSRPYFENAPDRNSPMWKHMVENRET